MVEGLPVPVFVMREIGSRSQCSSRERAQERRLSSFTTPSSPPSESFPLLSSTMPPSPQLPERSPLPAPPTPSPTPSSSPPAPPRSYPSPANSQLAPRAAAL